MISMVLWMWFDVCRESNNHGLEMIDLFWGCGCKSWLTHQVRSFMPLKGVKGNNTSMFLQHRDTDQHVECKVCPSMGGSFFILMKFSFSKSSDEVWSFWALQIWCGMHLAETDILMIFTVCIAWKIGVEHESVFYKFGSIKTCSTYFNLSCRFPLRESNKSELEA